MFVESGFLYEQLNDIMFNGQLTVVEPIFVEFNEYLRSLGLDVLVSTYAVRSQLRAGQPSHMTIYLRTTENMVKNEIDPRIHNWGLAHKHTSNIVACWKALLSKHGFPESHVADTIHVDFYNFEELYMNFLLRRCKAEVEQAINNMLEDRGPQYIFCSSEPAYRIVFATQRDFSTNLGLGYFKKICDLCESVLAGHDLFAYYRPGVVKIHFHHREDKNLNMYGLSRED